MSTSLPERPDLDQLRRQAKELRDRARRGDPTALERIARHYQSAQGEVTLAAAQLVIARELGFSSWPRLKAKVDEAAAPARQEQALLAACLEGRLQQAADIVRADPDIAGQSLRAAAVLAESTQIREMLAADPAAAVAVDYERGWPAILYACYSRWHQLDPDREPPFVEVVRLLLDAGATPNTNNGARPHHGYRSALHGSVVANKPAVTRLLLERGTNPNDGESLYQAATHRDHMCLELLLAHGATVAGTWALEVAVHAGDTEAVTMLLRAAEQAPGQAAALATQVLPDAAADGPTAIVASLLAAGADPGARDGDELSALRRAVRAGNTDSATALVAGGARDDASDIDRFVGACMQADRLGAERLLVDHPGLIDRLAESDRAAIVDAAGTGATAAMHLMLDLGLSPHTRNGLGETALHTAAYMGSVEAIQILLEAGAELDARDANFDATPLAFATVGSGEQAGQPGNWIETVRLLIEAGASREGVWISGKPPSEEVAKVLRDYGITPGRAGRAAAVWR
jgi:ankyrin repeat protein